MHEAVRRAALLSTLLATVLLAAAAPAAAGPSIQVTSAPPATTTATIAFRVVGFVPTSVTCSLDGGSAKTCRSPVTYTGLAARDHSLRIVARNSRTSTSTTVRWRVVQAVPAPTVSITSAPPSQTNETSATIGWIATGADRVEASLDGGAYTQVSSPVTLSGLGVGRHQVVVRATNAAGAATASASWTIVAPPPPPPLSPSAPAPPSPPGGYAVPAGAVRVATAAELQAALDAPAAQDIVLAEGVYGTSGWFRNRAGHRLYAEHSGSAILTSGLEIGANWGDGGAIVRGIVFDVSDPSAAFHGALVHAWGPGGARLEISDCVFRGNGVAAYGLLVYSPEGLVAERLTFAGFTDVALRASDNQAVPYGASTPRIQRIADVAVDGVTRASPGASNGTAEAGLWIGHPVAEGVRRIRVRNASWSGIETVNNAWNTTFSDLDIDMSGPFASAAVGVYLEHFNHRNTFERFQIRGATFGFVAEWADPAWGGVAGAHETVIRDGVIDAGGAPAAKTWGVYLDEGTVSTTVTGVRFENQSFAAIGAYEVAGTNSFEGNDASGILPGAKAFSTAHHSSPTP